MKLRCEAGKSSLFHLIHSDVVNQIAQWELTVIGYATIASDGQIQQQIMTKPLHLRVEGVFCVAAKSLVGGFFQVYFVQHLIVYVETDVANPCARCGISLPTAGLLSRNE